MGPAAHWLQPPFVPDAPLGQGTHSPRAEFGCLPAAHRLQISPPPAFPLAHALQSVRSLLGSLPTSHLWQRPPPSEYLPASHLSQPSKRLLGCVPGEQVLHESMTPLLVLSLWRCVPLTQGLQCVAPTPNFTTLGSLPGSQCGTDSGSVLAWQGVPEHYQGLELVLLRPRENR